MQCYRPIEIFGGKTSSGNWRIGTGMTVPCGKCMGCKKQRARDWSIRLFHEMIEHKRSCFITLTYNDDNYPSDGSVSKRELQLFFKRLRKYYEERKIKYFACGEYGERSERAHYHAIIFGIGGIKDLKLYAASKKNGKDTFASRTIEELWSLGNNVVGSVDIKSINYVVGYIRKKLGTKEYTDREPPFQLQSQGLGLAYAERNKERIETLNLTFNGEKVTVPRYYLKKLGKNQELINEHMERSAEKASKYACERKLDVLEVRYRDRYQRELNQKALDSMKKRDGI